MFLTPNFLRFLIKCCRVLPNLYFFTKIKNTRAKSATCHYMSKTGAYLEAQVFVPSSLLYDILRLIGGATPFRGQPLCLLFLFLLLRSGGVIRGAGQKAFFVRENLSVQPIGLGFHVCETAKRVGYKKCPQTRRQTTFRRHNVGGKALEAECWWQNVADKMSETTVLETKHQLQNARRQNFGYTLYHTKLAKLSFEEFFDLTAEAFFFFFFFKDCREITFGGSVTYLLVHQCGEKMSREKTSERPGWRQNVRGKMYNPGRNSRRQKKRKQNRKQCLESGGKTSEVLGVPQAREQHARRERKIKKKGI